MKDTKTRNNKIQPIQEVEEEFISSGYERNIHIPKVGQIHHSECI